MTATCRSGDSLSIPIRTLQAWSAVAHADRRGPAGLGEHELVRYPLAFNTSAIRLLAITQLRTYILIARQRQHVIDHSVCRSRHSQSRSQENGRLNFTEFIDLSRAHELSKTVSDENGTRNFVAKQISRVGKNCGYSCAENPRLRSNGRDAVKIARISRESGCGLLIKDIEDGIQSCCFEPLMHTFARRRDSHGAAVGFDQLID